jgi:uncharacterized protein
MFNKSSSSINSEKSKMKKILILFMTILLTCCSAVEEKHSDLQSAPDYPIQPVPFTSVNVTDSFWSGRIETNRTVTIPSSFKKCEETGRIDNFDMASGIKEGGFQSKYPYDDSDVYKIMEGAAYSLATYPDPQLEKYLDDLIAKVAGAQEDDGYLMTWRTIDPGTPPTDWAGETRWANTKSGHELYNVGHMYEAATAHFQATGKRTFLDVAIKNADFIAESFGPGRLMLPPGHEEIEIGLVKLYRVTGNSKYLDLAKFFLDQRGNEEGHDLYGMYNQDHIAVIEQKEAVGHAVRAAYLYAGMADIAALTGNSEYLEAIDHIWNNVVNKKLYIIGGIGATREGEAFGENYQLPNDSAYNETCAAIANIFWNQRMFLLKGDAAYIDVLERSLYNNMLAGVSLKGDTFFYPNVLDFDGNNTFNQGESCRKEWFNCSCCPSNVSRFIPSVPGYIYGTKDETIFINLYIGNEAEIQLQGNQVGIGMVTDYPWNGSVKIEVSPEQETAFSVKLRIPGWALNQPVPGDLYRFLNQDLIPFSVSINGETFQAEPDQGYLTITRAWKPGDTIQLELPMPVRLVQAHEKVEADAGKAAVQRGPLVCCAEAADNMSSFLSLALTEKSGFEERFEADILQGALFLNVKSGKNQVNLIPYYAWANREVGAMKVWFPLEEN